MPANLEWQKAIYLFLEDRVVDGKDGGLQSVTWKLG